MANTTKATKKKKAEFIKALSETANVTIAARSINMDRRHMYRIKEADEQFSADWDAAIDEAVDLLEKEAQRRAFEGTNKPVFYQGKKCGAIREYSDTLAIFLLKAHRPERYRDRSEVNLNGGLDVVVHQPEKYKDPREWEKNNS